MLKQPRLVEARIARALSLVKDRIYSAGVPLAVEICETPGEPSFPARIPESGFKPMKLGDRWGIVWSTAWFRFSGTVPAAWHGQAVSALIELGSLPAATGFVGEGFAVEGLVWMDGKPVRAINVNRADVPLAAPAQGGEAVNFLVEGAANPKAEEWLPFGNPEPGPEEGPLYALERAELAIYNTVAWELYHDLDLVNGTMLELPETSPRRGHLLRTCNEALNILDFDDLATYPAAREVLAAAMAAHNGTTSHQVSAVGHAHIDTAWLWPLRETIRKCARTFSSQLAYMADHPEYVFACSQAQQYAWMKEYYPHIFEGIRAAVKRGQWEPVGSMWIEMDCNIPSGESMVRQILHGKNFFLDEFGIETRDCWLPDVFGYSAAMPQILLKSGIDSFMTQKISWNKFNKFPHHTFLWQGLDGTRVFSHFPPADTYNGRMNAKELAFNVANFRENDRATRSLYLFGFGDGGGGPTREMLASASRLADFEGLPKVKLEKASTFFEKAKADAKALPVWVGELYLEMHRGTYTTQAKTKLGNRKSEFLLREAELLDVLAGRSHYAVAPGIAEPERAPYDVIARAASSPAAYLDRAWKLLLLNQFHDIIPGSSIKRVYEENAADYAVIGKLAAAVIEPARKALLDRINTSGAQRPIVVFNSASFARTEIVSLPGGSPIHVEVPPMGYAVVDAAEQRPVASYAHPVEVTERKRLVAIDNGMLRIIIDRETGNIRNIQDHRFDREVLAPGHEANVFQLLRDIPQNYDAWDIEHYAYEMCDNVGGLTSLTVAEAGEMRAVLLVQRKFGKSTISQRIIVCAGSTRIDFETEVDWQEDHKMLKVAFPVNIHASRATYEIPFGHTDRPTHSNTSWDAAQFEVCAQKWADLGEGDYGVALLNDCKYGYDIHGNVMRLSLLRSPTAPDLTADRGLHKFTYALLPHGRNFRKGGVIEQAFALNVPLTLVETEAHEGKLPAKRSFFEIDRPGLIIEAVKYAETGDSVIIRLSEANGSRGTATLTTTLPIKHAFEADLMERTGAPVNIERGKITFPVKPFEILTFKLILA